MSLVSSITGSIPNWCYRCKAYIPHQLKSHTDSLCQTCYTRLPTASESYCRHCGLDHQTAKCNHDLAAAIDGFDYLYTYTDPIKGWISSLKYSKNFIAGRILQTLISLWLDNNNEKFRSIDHLVPIPISKRRLYLRGFNQTVYLLNTQTGLSLDLHCVKKIKHTPQQASLNRVERERIQKESFGVIKDLRGKKILLFDDVCTTGHTLAEISKSLKNDGVAEVHVLVLCRSLVQ